MHMMCSKVELSRPGEKSFTWISAGDFCMPYLTEAQIEGTVAPEINELVSGCDVSTVDIEAPIIRAGKAAPGKVGPSLSSQYCSASLIRKAGFKTAVLANNHIMDFGTDGLNQTVAACKEAGLSTVGVGANARCASMPLILDGGKQTIAMAGFTEREFSSAGENSPGAAVFEPLTAGQAVGRMKSQADVVLVNVHGGSEYCVVASPRLIAWCRHLADCGADAIVVHHQHVAQGYEIYNGVPIIYSLGHFLFDWKAARPKCWYEGLLCKLTFSDGRCCGIELTGIEQKARQCGVSLAVMEEEKQQRLGERLEYVNKILGDEERLKLYWQCFCKSKSQSYLSSLKLGGSSLKCDLVEMLKIALRRRDLGALWSMPAQIIAPQSSAAARGYSSRLKNILSCPSHHEAVDTILEMQLGGVEPLEETWKDFLKLNAYCSFG